MALDGSAEQALSAPAILLLLDAPVEFASDHKGCDDLPRGEDGGSAKKAESGAGVMRTGRVIEYGGPGKVQSAEIKGPRFSSMALAL